LGKPIKFMNRQPAGDIPISLATIGPKNVELTAEMADIWQTIHFVPDRFQQVWGDSLAAGTAKRDPNKAPLEIIAGGTVALGSGTHVDEAREAARGLIGFYVGGMGAKSKNFYNDLFVRERIQVFKDVGVTYLNVTPHGPNPLGTIEKIKAWSE
jgi:alkanesulfonate monooxygenase SsuD/methylene tetrahydromethanopterin reductase-like flavin-dependent oxidoreductase (luciferase family)